MSNKHSSTDIIDLTETGDSKEEKEEEESSTGGELLLAATKEPRNDDTNERKRRRDDDVATVSPSPTALSPPSHDIARSNRATKKVCADTFDCSICLESGVHEFIGYKLVECSHEFCRECLHTYITGKVKEKSVGPALICPEVQCKSLIQNEDVRACSIEIGDISLWHSYQEVSTEKFLDTAATDKWEERDDKAGKYSLRRCPNEHCNFTFEYMDPGENHPEGRIFQCPSCTEMYCLNCPVVGGGVGPPHDHSCQRVLRETEESEERRRKLEEWKRENENADVRFKELLEKEEQTGQTKPCPTCGIPITKNGGCSHMHCTQCGTEYNW